MSMNFKVVLYVLIVHSCYGFFITQARWGLKDTMSSIRWTTCTCNLKITEEVWATSFIDYSAANEYIYSHYNQSHYFGKDTSVMENLFDARESQSTCQNNREILQNYGLALVNSSLQLSNWSNLNDIGESYLPELDRIINLLFPSKQIHCFWNPMIRGEAYEISRIENNTKTPTANIASMAHIDNDIGAYQSVDDFLSIIDKNKVQPFRKQDFADAIIKGNKRFAVVNFWRNIGMAPVTRAPLAILSTEYDEGEKFQAFPNASPNMNRSRWYVFPNATRDEVIVFYQYDRLITQPSDLWHCAVSLEDDEIGKDNSHNGQVLPRESFDIRALIVFDEIVPQDVDRYTPSRQMPLLSFEESGCFCDEQAEKRLLDDG